MNTFFYFLIPVFAGIIGTLILMRVSEKTHFLVDVPEGDALKIHKKSIPLLGGCGMLLTILIGMTMLLGNGNDKGLIYLFLAILPVFFLGFYDDLKWKHVSTIKPMLKFALLLVCTFLPALILSFTGIGFYFIPMFAASLLLSFVYIFLCINSVNYQDGMDGLAGGEVFISLMGFLWLSFIYSHTFVFILILIFLGAVFSFLHFNLPPARIFMGDSGAYSLGLLLAMLAMIFSEPYNIFSVLGPLFIIGLPIFDGIYTNIRRIMAGKSIFLGDRSHFYDKLLQKGFSTKKTLAICYSIQIILVAIGILLYK